jgi:glutamate synthase (ferredoxin)
MFVEGPGLDAAQFKRASYIFRRQIRGAADFKGLGPDSLYICSLGEKTVTYKGMVNSYSLGTFYKDLVDPRFKCRFAIYHRRFSTNTTPKWPLAQPMRMLGHNGEINTLLGNVNWMRARSAAQDSCDISQLLDSDNNVFQNCDTSFIDGMGSLVDTTRSDSANMDSIFELYSKSGRPMAEALRFMVPEAYENGRVGADPTSPDFEMEKDVVGFYDFHAPLQEAWDGPALICFSDGDILGATLDRNGLRPARYTRLKDGTVYLMSETGVVPLDDGDVVEKGRLGPGQMINVDLKTGEFKSNQDIRKMIAKSQPWRELVENTQFALKFDKFGDAYNVIDSDEEATRSTTVIRNQVAFGWGVEDLTMMVSAMASTGGEATFSMGDDAPLAVLSDRPHVLYDYFRQRFAQVTNPPIDPLREGEVMSLKMFLGPRGHVLNDVDDASTTRLVSISSPVLNGPELTQLKSKFGADGVSPRGVCTAEPREARKTCKTAAAAVHAERIQGSSPRLRHVGNGR